MKKNAKPKLREFVRLQRWMRKGKITQQQLAFHCDVSMGFIHQLLKGKYVNVSIVFLHRLSEVTKIRSYTLMRDLLILHKVNGPKPKDDNYYVDSL